MSIANNLAVVFTLIFTSFSFGQETGVSPYSRFGLGDFNNLHSPAYRSMGGASVSLSDFNQLNIDNAASYAFLKSYRPVFEADFKTQLITLESTEGQANVRYSNIAKFSLGIPLSKKVGLGFGLLPYTNVGYDVISSDTISGTGQVDYLYNGLGGLNRVYLGLGYMIMDNDTTQISIGGDVSYIFGGIEQEKRTEFPDLPNAQYALVSEQTRYRGFSAQIGAQYKQQLNNNIKISIGSNISLGNQLNGKRDVLTATYDENFIAERIVDTVSYQEGVEGNVEIPLGINVGASLEYNKNFTIAAQYKKQDWSKFKQTFGGNNSADSLQEIQQFSFGLRYRPFGIFTKENIFQRIECRLGTRFGSTNLKVNNTSIDEFGMSFGLGIPLAKSETQTGYKSVSMLNIGVEYGNRGTTDNSLIRENFTNIYVGVSIMPTRKDRWFRKRKIN